MRDAQTLTVDKHAALFEHCDIFVETDDDAWTLIVANPKARAVVDQLIDMPFNWNFGTPLREWWTRAPADWRAVSLHFSYLEQEGRLSRLPKLGNVGTDTHRYTLQVAIAAKEAGLRVVIYDGKTGWQTINLQDEHNVIDFATAREAITQHRVKSHSYLDPNGATQSLQFDPSGKLIDQKVTLPGLPGGPPLVPTLPAVKFENGHLSSGRGALERIVRNGKAEPVVPQFDKPGPVFPSHIHLFELSPNICNSISSDDRKQMLADLQTARLLHLPFHQIAVRFYLPDLVPKSNRKVLVTFCVSGPLSVHTRDANLLSADKMFDRVAVQTLDGKTELFSVGDPTGASREDAKTALQPVNAELVTICLDALTTLVLALATRNVVKHTTENKRINNKHKQSKPQFRGPQGAIYLSSTVVKAPDAADMDDDPDHPAQDGTAKRPHMRRGHLHTVLHGIGRRERCVRWFPAVFVNADPAFVADARKYIVTH